MTRRRRVRRRDRPMGNGDRPCAIPDPTDPTRSATLAGVRRMDDGPPWRPCHRHARTDTCRATQGARQRRRPTTSSSGAAPLPERHGRCIVTMAAHTTAPTNIWCLWAEQVEINAARARAAERKRAERSTGARRSRATTWPSRSAWPARCGTSGRPLRRRSGSTPAGRTPGASKCRHAPKPTGDPQPSTTTKGDQHG